MGSRTPDEGRQDTHGGSHIDAPIKTVPKARGNAAPDDDNRGGDGGGDDDDDDGPEVVNQNGNNNNTTDKPENHPGTANGTTTSNNGDQAETAAGPKKPRKKRRNKPKKKAPATQSTPPRVPVANLFPSSDFPPGEIQSYVTRTATTSKPGSVLEKPQLTPEIVGDFRKAAEVHRQVRRYAQEIIRPGVGFGWVAEEIEAGVRALVGADGMDGGMGFPTGLAANEIAAHYTPGPNSGWKENNGDRVLQKGDVLKVDFGVHVKGRIVDSAFTVAFEEKWDPLLAAVKAATNTGIKESGIDARISEIGAAIQETMESYEVEVKPGHLVPVKAVRSITGHDIKHYRIHGDKQVPFVRNNSKVRMEEGEVFAIETFGTTGSAELHDSAGVYGYGLNPHAPRARLNLSSARSLLKTIEKQFGTIVFCRRYLERLGVERYLLGLNSLVSNDIVNEYKPLSDVKGSYVAQFEHPEAKEVVSRGDDY